MKPILDAEILFLVTCVAGVEEVVGKMDHQQKADVLSLLLCMYVGMTKVRKQKGLDPAPKDHEQELKERIRKIVERTFK